MTGDKDMRSRILLCTKANQSSHEGSARLLSSVFRRSIDVQCLQRLFAGIANFVVLTDCILTDGSYDTRALVKSLSKSGIQREIVQLN
jgi:hypothetical protein